MKWAVAGMVLAIVVNASIGLFIPLVLGVASALVWLNYAMALVCFILLVSLFKW